MNDETNKEQSQSFGVAFSKIIELVFHVENGLKCQKCGKEKSWLEYAQECQQIKAELEAGNMPQNTDLFACDCGGKFSGTIEIKEDEQTK